MKNEINIKEYTSYFHDGIVHDIKHTAHSIILSIESAQLIPDWNKDNIALSERKTLSGNLCLDGVSNIEINGKSFKGVFKITHDDGNIHHIDIVNNKVILEVSWENYSLREETDVFTICISFKKSHWENIPDLFDVNWK